jgi:hypothetical protein
VQSLFGGFDNGRQDFWNLVDTGKNVPSFWTAYNTAALYSVPLWGLVKSWEINNEFQLEGLSQAVYGPQGSPRAWVGNLPFFSSPAIDGIPATNLKNGQQSTHDYVAFAWYHLQLILNDSNKQQSDTYPIDWGYVYGNISAMAKMVGPTTALQYEWQIRALQIENNGIGPDVKYTGWNWFLSAPYFLATPASNTFTGEAQATRIALAEGFLRSWLAVVSQFTPQQFYRGDPAMPTEVPNPGLANVLGPQQRFIDSMWYSIPQFRYIGVNQTLINQLAAWAQTVWPQANWAATTTASCAIRSSTPACSTE